MRLVNLTVMITTSLAFATAEAGASDKSAVATSISNDYVVATVEVEANTTRVWKTLTDYDGATAVFSGLKKCELVGERDGSKLVRQVVKPSLMPLRFDYLLNIREEPENLLIKFESIKGSLQKCEGFWKITQLEEKSRSRVSYAVNIAGNTLIPSGVLRQCLKGYSATLMLQLKTYIERVRPVDHL